MTKPEPVDRMRENPKVLIIAGPNGAGKTTLATEYLPNEADCHNFVNADLIAAGLSPFKPDAVQFRAGRVMLEVIQELTRKEVSFGLETTMSGRLYRYWIPTWQSVGYRVAIHFLHLRSPRLAISRVAGRVRAGGHSIPENVVTRRYRRGWREFKDISQNLVDEWTIYDTSSVDPIVVSSKERGLDSASDTTTDESNRDAEIRSALAALYRAKEVAHRTAAERNDRIAIFRHGKVVLRDPLVDQNSVLP